MQVIETEKLTYSTSLADNEKHGGISVVSFSTDSQKCAVGYENGSIMLYDTNGWTPLKTKKNFKVFEKPLPVVAADWTLDSKYLVVENIERKAVWLEITDKGVSILPGPDHKNLSKHKWRSGELYSNWQVPSDDLDHRVQEADQSGRVQSGLVHVQVDELGS